MVRTQNPRKSRCKPKERLRENTVRMQTDDLPPNRFTTFSNISWHSTRVFSRVLGHGSSTLAPPPLNSRSVFSAISSGDQFWGSPGRAENHQKAAELWSCVLEPVRAKGGEVYLSHPPSPLDPSLADLQNTRKNSCGMQ